MRPPIPLLLAEHKIAGSTAEGYLFPATYDLALDSDPDQVVSRMVTEFGKRFERLARDNAMGAEALRQRMSWGPAEIVTLASIVEKEAAVDEERPLIASVFLNRLSDPTFNPKRLQSDPTSAYGCLAMPERIGSCRSYSGRVTPEMNADDANPYTTYRHEGLPPGPIANPGEKSLQAVLVPAETRHFYFVVTRRRPSHFQRHVRAAQRSHPPSPRRTAMTPLAMPKNPPLLPRTAGPLVAPRSAVLCLARPHAPHPSCSWPAISAARMRAFGSTTVRTASSTKRCSRAAKQHRSPPSSAGTSRHAKARVSAAVLGIAGPVVGGVVRTTNLPWTADERRLARDLDIPRVRLVNDLAALAIGCTRLGPASKKVLARGRAVDGANMAVIAAGTGLGEALLVWDGTKFLPCPTEGGHSDYGSYVRARDRSLEAPLRAPAAVE